MVEKQHDSHHRPPKQDQKRTVKAEEVSRTTSPTKDTVQLQALIGNQAVQRLIAQGHTILPSGRIVQAKLTVTSADNAYESEADAVAEQVVSQIASSQQGLQTKRDSEIAQRAAEEDELQMKRDPLIAQRAAEEDEMMAKRVANVVQRAAEEDELMAKRVANVVQRAAEEDEMMAKRAPDIAQRAAEEDEMMAKRGGKSLADSFEVDTKVEQTIKSEQGRGQAMPVNLQRSMEGAFGADFSNVRVHTDAVSNDLNTQVGARAFTTGSDLFFRDGEYRPDSPDGQKLLAHELTHTIQQDAVRRKTQGDE